MAAPYVYAGNDRMDATDPTGLRPTTDGDLSGMHPTAVAMAPSSAART